MAKTGYKKKRDQAMLDVVGKNIRYYRQQKEIKQVKFANMCNIEPKMLYSYEYGKVEIGVSMVALIAKQLGLEPNVLLIPREELK